MISFHTSVAAWASVSSIHFVAWPCSYCLREWAEKHLAWNRCIFTGALSSVCSRILWFKTRWCYGRKMLLCLALAPCCPPLLQPNPIYRLPAHLLISSCHSHLFSRSLSIFFLPSIWHFLLPFPSILLPIPSATLLSSCLTWLDPVYFLPFFLPSLLLFPNPLLPDPYPWWHHLEY